MTVKNFNLKLLLENKIQGLGFVFSDRPTFCKTNHQTSMLLKDSGAFLTDLTHFPFEGHYVYRFYLEQKICIDIFKESK